MEMSNVKKREKRGDELSLRLFVFFAFIFRLLP